MRQRNRRNVDLCSILRASDWAKEYLRRSEQDLRNMTEDPQKDDRLAKMECVVCFYPFRGRIGGTMCTSSQCGICQKTIHSSNTNIDVVCLDCAKAHDLCKHCGGDIRMRTRRKFDPAVVLPTLDEESTP